MGLNGKNTNCHHFSRMLLDLLKKSLVTLSTCNYALLGHKWSTSGSGATLKIWPMRSECKWFDVVSLRGVARLLNVRPYGIGMYWALIGKDVCWPFSTCLIWPWGSRSRLKGEYNTIQYNTIQYNTIQYNTIQYNTIQYNTIQYNM